MTGIDTSAASTLTSRLRQWSTQTDDVAVLVIQAETLSDVPSSAGPLLDQIGSDGTTLATQITRAIDELTNFRISEISTFSAPSASQLPAGLRLSLREYGGTLTASQRAEAGAILQRVTDAIEDGRVPNARDDARLHQLFRMGIGDEAAAAAAVQIALRGFPPEEVVLLSSVEDVHAIFDHVAMAMAAGISPADAGLPRELFPPEYRRWHQTERLIAAALDGLGDGKPTAPEVTAFFGFSDKALAEQQALQLTGFNGNTFSFDDDGSVSKFAAVSTTAAWGGRTTSSWLGDALAPVFGSADPTETLQIGAIVRSDFDAALSFMNELGAEGVAGIPQTLGRRNRGDLAATLSDYATALATVSGSSGLGFTGAHLIQADVDAGSEPYDSPVPDMYAELLLQVPNYDRDFVLDGAVASLNVRGDSYHRWSNWRSMNTDEPSDPRSIALQAVVNNAVVTPFVLGLVGRGGLQQLLDPDRRWHRDSPHLVDADGSPLSKVLEMAGLDRTASFAVLSYFHERGGYEEVPLGTELDGFLGETLNEMRRIQNPQVLAGLSAMLATSAHFYLAETVPVDDYAQHQLQSPYFSTYHTVLNSGSGNQLLQATQVMAAERIQTDIARGVDTLDLTSLTRFIGTVRAVRNYTFLNNAKLKDQAAANLSSDLSWLGVGVGLVSGGIATTASAGLGVASNVTGSDNGALALAIAQLDEQLALGVAVRQVGLLAIFGSGKVVTQSGAPVTLKILDDANGPAFRLIDDTGAPIHLGNAETTSYRFETFDVDLGELQVNGESLNRLLLGVESFDTAIDNAQRRATQRITD